MDDNYVAIDACHIDLIYGLIRASKPTEVLEMGFGTGRTTKAILEALDANNKFYSYVLVENFKDVENNLPERKELVEKIDSLLFDKNCVLKNNDHQIIKSNEREAVEHFVKENKKFDFIVSDADHDRSHNWFDKTISLLSENGIGIFHDILHKDYPNLRKNIQYCKEHNLVYQVFSNSSTSEELCERGLLVVFKKENK